MKERVFPLFMAMFIFLFIVNLFVGLPARADNGKEYEQYLKQPGLHSKIINYLRDTGKAEKPLDFKITDFIVLSAIDLLLSLSCLWLAGLLLIRKRALTVKSCSWFLFILNLSWFIFLLFLKVAWQALYFLVVKLRPDLGQLVIDNFSLLVIVSAVLIYIWLLARAFELNFIGASYTLLASHLCYLLIIFLFFLSVNFQENRFFNLAKKNLGIRPIVQTYLSDVGKITSGRDMLSFIRVRAFHL